MYPGLRFPPAFAVMNMSTCRGSWTAGPTARPGIGERPVRSPPLSAAPSGAESSGQRATDMHFPLAQLLNYSMTAASPLARGSVSVPLELPTHICKMLCHPAVESPGSRSHSRGSKSKKASIAASSPWWTRLTPRGIGRRGRWGGREPTPVERMMIGHRRGHTSFSNTVLGQGTRASAKLGRPPLAEPQKPQPQTLRRQGKNTVRKQLALVSQMPRKVLERHFSTP
uniref:Uncharacterized protein n=1 Tax=Molossus molossus TaxID=27622 RepID=A0A7J8JXE3_MOLMO|nr:hypothetical protein HJG59_008111 [Molossus molossus]